MRPWKLTMPNLNYMEQAIKRKNEIRPHEQKKKKEKLSTLLGLPSATLKMDLILVPKDYRTPKRIWRNNRIKLAF
jgi:hypothetical protein